ncbi:MAG: radical SAM protein [Nanoarchaeota archaeon]|nr:radical SAM protein [Nanoarchaeota archaeon]
MVLELTKKEHETFKKHAHKKRFPKEHKQFFETLSAYEMTNFEDYQPKRIPIKYSQKLLNHNDSTPVFKSPIIAHLGITSACNMNCKYCSIRTPYHKLKELSTNEWKKIIKKLCDLGVFQIGFTGGEPTLRKDIVELAKFVTAQKSTFNLTTNCWKLDEKLIVELKNVGMKQCQVSLDCHTPKINDKLRTKGSAKKVSEAIKLLQKHEIIVGIDCVVSKNNLTHIPEFVKWLNKMNVQYLTIIKIKQGDLPIKTFKKLLPGYNEYSKLIEQLCNRENINPCITIDCGSVSNLHYTLKNEEIKKIPVAGCPAGHTLLSISPNGDIFPCVALSKEKHKIGNALHDDLKKIWVENNTLRELREIKKRVTGKCKTCDRLNHCRAGCRGIVESLYNDLWASDITCEKNKNMMGG